MSGKRSKILEKSGKSQGILLGSKCRNHGGVLPIRKETNFSQKLPENEEILVRGPIFISRQQRAGCVLCAPRSTTETGEADNFQIFIKCHLPLLCWSMHVHYAFYHCMSVCRSTCSSSKIIILYVCLCWQTQKQKQNPPVGPRGLLLQHYGVQSSQNRMSSICSPFVSLFVPPGRVEIA